MQVPPSAEENLLSTLGGLGSVRVRVRVWSQHCALCSGSPGTLGFSLPGAKETPLLDCPANALNTPSQPSHTMDYYCQFS